MANVSNIKTIINNTTASLYFKSGTDSSFNVNAGSTWHGDLWVPWIGEQSENYKAIKITSPDAPDVQVYVFQDYWNPAGANAIKYCDGDFSYGGAIEINGDNKGGGNKELLVNPDITGTTITLKIMKSL